MSRIMSDGQIHAAAAISCPEVKRTLKVYLRLLRTTVVVAGFFVVVPRLDMREDAHGV